MSNFKYIFTILNMYYQIYAVDIMHSPVGQNQVKLEIAWYISAIYKPVFVPLHKNYAFQK